VLKKSADELQGFQTNFLKNLSVNFDEINNQSKSLSENIKTTAANVQHCNQVFDGKFSTNLELAGESLKDLSELSRISKTINSDVSEGLVTQIKSFEQLFAGRLNTFQSEIKQIDGLIDSFIEATRKKIIN